MRLLIQYLAIYAPWIYALCGLVALYHIYKTWQVRSERRQALFSLEREKALRDLFNILFVCLLLLFVMGVTYFSSEVLARAIQVEQAIRPLATATIPPFQPLPTVTATSILPLPGTNITDTLVTDAGNTDNAADAAPVLEVPQPAEPVATDTPAPPPAPAALCPDPRVQLTSPGAGQAVTGQVTIAGSATHEQFSYYKLEYAPGANAQEGFVYLSGGNAAVAGGVVGAFNSADLPNGPWTLRLVVVDLTGNFPPPCSVTVNIQN